jgi:hypothetical protein
VPNLKELEKQREALLRQKAALELIESKKADALKAAQKRAEDEEKRVAAAAEYQLKLKTAYEKTEAGQKEATKTAIAYWEAQLAKGKNVKEISAILEDLKKSIEEESFAMSNMTNNLGRGRYRTWQFARALEVAKESFEAIGQGFGQVGEWSAPLDAAYQSFLGIGQGFGQIGEIIEETTEKIWENKDAMRALSHSVSDILDSLGTVWSNYYAAQMEGLDKSSDEYKKIAREQASAEKAWGIFMALINTAVAVTKALSSAPPPWNIALATAAGIAGAAQVAAIASQPLPALGEGGIVTKPTYALMGEKGPEAVIPLNKSSGAGLGNITIIVNGSVMEEEGLARKLGGIIARQRRGLKIFSAAWKTQDRAFTKYERVNADFRQYIYPPYSSTLTYTAITSADNQPGVINVTGGYCSYVLPMDSKFTLFIRCKPTFAYNVSSSQHLCEWYIDATHCFRVYYSAGGDCFYAYWHDGGSNRVLQSAVYTSNETLQTWHNFAFSIDLTTGTTAGSAFYINQAAVETAWSGNTDVKASNFPILTFRTYSGGSTAYSLHYQSDALYP